MATKKELLKATKKYCESLPKGTYTANIRQYFMGRTFVVGTEEFRINSKRRAWRKYKRRQWLDAVCGNVKSKESKRQKRLNSK